MTVVAAYKAEDPVMYFLVCSSASPPERSPLNKDTVAEAKLESSRRCKHATDGVFQIAVNQYGIFSSRRRCEYIQRSADV